MTDFVPGEGDVPVTLGGKTMYLVPTLEACMRVSRSGATGPRILGDQCMALNFDAICFVIACGLGKKQEEVQKDVYEAGTTGLFAPCIKFLHNVSNGGRPYKEADGTGADQDPPQGG